MALTFTTPWQLSTATTDSGMPRSERSLANGDPVLHHEILESVGDGGQNRVGDVTLAQVLLNSKGFTAGRADGVCGTKTIAAIRAFQATFLTAPDGIIEPSKSTWRHLIRHGGTMPGRATLLAWSGDSSRWSQDKKLSSMHVELSPKGRTLIAALSKRGFQPTIHFGWRSVAVQREIFKRGHSKVRFSFHNAQQRGGTPNSYAADIIDTRFGWSNAAAVHGFWEALGQEAKVQGLHWGGDWKTFKDVAHVQLVPNSALARVKEESGL
jgi:peptidoglycan hydrolase-like protein with peptidoglycan-binding domain